MVEGVNRLEDVNGEAVALGQLLGAHRVVPVHVACRAARVYRLHVPLRLFSVPTVIDRDSLTYKLI